MIKNYENDVKQKNKDTSRFILSFSTFFVFLMVFMAVDVTTNVYAATKTITINIDCSDLIEKGHSIDNLNFVMEGIKTNTPKSYSDFVSRAVSKSNSSYTVKTYAITISDDIKYIIIRDDKFENYTCDTAKIDTIYDDYNESLYYGIELEDGVNEYNLVATERQKITVTLDRAEGVMGNGNDESVYVVDSTNNYIITTTDFIEKNSFEFYAMPDMDYNILMYSNLNGVYEEDTLLPKRFLSNIKNMCYSIYYCKEVSKDSTKTEYTFKLKERATPTISTSVNWIDENTAKLEFNLINADNMYGKNLHKAGNNFIFAEKIDDDFEVSSKYTNNSEWLIINEDEIKDKEFINVIGAKIYLSLNDNEYIPEYVYATFMNSEDLTIGDIKYIYVKDKHMLYYAVETYSDYYAENSAAVELIYTGDSTESGTYSFSTKAVGFYTVWGCSFYQRYETQDFADTLIVSNALDNATVTIDKVVEGQNGTNTYYAGLFSNDTDVTTSKIYRIDTVDGKGSVDITIENYDKTSDYYIYEVDENGNKINDVMYNKNKILDNAICNSEYKVSSDTSVVSSVSITDADEIGTGSGEEYYVNNALAITNAYEDTITIRSEEKAYVVNYISDEGGKIDGDATEIVKTGERPVNVPNVTEDEYYNFVAWFVEKNGELVEVNPLDYVVNEDTIFIAKHKKIEYAVTYKTEDRGSLSGDISEIVKAGNTPVNIPEVVADDGYEFYTWYVEKDGELIEVNPKAYVITSDTTFIAKFKTVEKVDTSDINFVGYIFISAISVIVISAVKIVENNRKRKLN